MPHQCTAGAFLNHGQVAAVAFRPRVHQRDWLLTADMLQLIHQAGYDVAELAQHVVEQRPLDDRPAEDLRYRIAELVPAEILNEPYPTESVETIHAEPSIGTKTPSSSPDLWPD